MNFCWLRSVVKGTKNLHDNLNMNTAKVWFSQDLAKLKNKKVKLPSINPTWHKIFFGGLDMGVGLKEPPPPYVKVG